MLWSILSLHRSTRITGIFHSMGWLSLGTSPRGLRVPWLSTAARLSFTKQMGAMPADIFSSSWKGLALKTVSSLDRSRTYGLAGFGISPGSHTGWLWSFPFHDDGPSAKAGAPQARLASLTRDHWQVPRMIKESWIENQSELVQLLRTQRRQPSSKILRLTLNTQHAQVSWNAVRLVMDQPPASHFW